MPRAAERIFHVALLLLGGCGQLLGINDYATSKRADASRGADSDKLATREEVTAFLGQGACADCIRDACPEEITKCAASSTCGSAAKCMGECTDPVCTATECRGAAQPTDPDLLALGGCAKKSNCVDTCNIGNSWSCVGKYDWRPATEAFQLPFELGVFQENRPLTNAAVDLCTPQLVCQGADLLGSATTDGLGQFELDVRPVKYLNTSYFPDPSLHVAATSTTHALRVESVSAMVPRPYRQAINVLSIAKNPGTYFYGLIFDCRGTTMMGAKGVDLVFTSPPTDPMVVFYWPDDEQPTPQVNSGTALSGVFSVPLRSEVGALPDAAAPNVQVPPGDYNVELRDRVTQEIRASYGVRINDDESTLVILYPWTAKQCAAPSHPAGCP